MIFAHTLDEVLSGIKSQTRRVAKPSEMLDTRKNLLGEYLIIHIPGKRTLYEVGKSYAVQPNRGKKAVARITVTGIRKERVLDITVEDARAEGFASRDDFIATWRSIHGEKADLHSEVWVIEFQLERIVANEFKALYEKRRISSNQSSNNCHDLPAALEVVPRTSMYGGSD